MGRNLLDSRLPKTINLAVLGDIFKDLRAVLQNTDFSQSFRSLYVRRGLSVRSGLRCVRCLAAFGASNACYDNLVEKMECGGTLKSGRRGAKIEGVKKRSCTIPGYFFIF